MFDNKNILITGGTGSFGRAFVSRILAQFNPNRVIIYSRDEMKQWEMEHSFEGSESEKLRFFIGDVRDKARLQRALDGVDFVVHAAATKIVPIAEYNPFECVKTNINGAMNLIDTAIDQGVKKVVALSTDKASSPVNLYGATKLVSDKLFVAGNSYTGDKSTKFSVVRYGNVMGSRGSIIPYFLSLGPNRKFPITDSRMTRFMITLDQGIDLVLHAFADMMGGEIYVKKIPSMKITDIAKAISEEQGYDAQDYEIVGIRPGEKLHEQMIGVDDAENTFGYHGHYKILPAINGWNKDPERIKTGKKVDGSFCYSSDNNSEWMSADELRSWINENRNVIGQF